MTLYTAQKKKGFSLIEVLISIFIFAIVITAASSILGRATYGYKSARVNQQVMEDAQFAMSRITKSLRTSSVISVGTAGQDIIIYDYSRDGGACIRYSLVSGVITEEVEPLDYATDDVLNCGVGIFDGNTQRADLTQFPVTGSFSAVASDYETRVGKVSMVFSMEGAQASILRLQTTVSLRDYDVSGLL